MNKNFIIYLDIDGVLVSYLKLKDRDPVDGKHIFNKESVDTLNALITLLDADLCVVSTWGRPYWNKRSDLDVDTNEFKTFLERRGIIVNDLTFGDPDDRVGWVIKRKLEGWVNFLIIDDESFEYYKRVDEIGFMRILATNPFRCLDEYDLITVSRNLKSLNKFK